MTRVCSGCGLHSCEGRCYLESPADYPETEETISTLALDELIARHGSQLTRSQPDPLKHLEPKRNAA
jgi:hypothetical protein